MASSKEGLMTLDQIAYRYIKLQEVLGKLICLLPEIEEDRPWQSFP
ncbi:MAG: hypothetical protein Q9N26_04415 [Aquificota bacterium]|nr:hypothetical protein [Aquificota bacterium]